MTPTPRATWVARLTPPGRGAIATLGLLGPRAWDAARQFFRPRSGHLPPAPDVNRFWLGRLGDELRDDAILTVRGVRPTPYLELHCHGGGEIVAYLEELFEAFGLRPCSWREFVRLTADDPLQGAAAVALAEAPSSRTAAILLDQYQGAFRRALEAIRLHLDRGETDAALAAVQELARYGALGRRLTAPWRVTVAGAPNVGKSSLLNALAGYRRSIVAPTPGTTRDVVTVNLAVEGWPVEVADTAGLRAEAEALEGQGIARARSAAASADLCLWVLDASAPPAWPDVAARDVRLVVNKIDLPPAWDLSRAADAARVSARTGEGLPELCAALGRWLVPDAPPAGAAVPFTAELCDAVEALRGDLLAGRTAAARDRAAALNSPLPDGAF